MTDINALFKRGEEAFQKRNYDYARDLFLNIVQVDPDNEKARESLFATCMQRNKESGGSGRIKLAFMHTKINMEMAGAKNNDQKRIDLALKYLCDDPQNSKIRTVLAEALKAQGHWNATAVESKLAVTSDPKNIVAAKMLVESLVHLDRVTEAQKILERISVFAPEDRDLMKLQRDLAAKMTMSKGFEDAAGRDGFRAAMKDSDRAADLERQQHLIVTEADLAAVVDRLKEELDANPTDAKIPKKIGELYFDKKKDWAEAREWFRKATLLAPQDSALRDRVDDCSLRLMDAEIEAAVKGNDPRLSELKATRLKSNIQSYERRVADRPTDMGLRFELGKSYYQAGMNDKAIGEFQQSIKDPKRKRDTHIYLGMAFQRKKMFDMADTQYAKAEEEGGGILTQATLLSIWYNRAVCNAEAGKKDVAITFGKKIVEQDISFRDISALVEKWTANGGS